MGAQAELIVPYDPLERKKYEEHDTTSVFNRPEYQYPPSLWHGIYRRGRFPEVAVRATLLKLGFSVLMSDPEMPNEGGYILTHYAGKRRLRHVAFERMYAWFPEAQVATLNQKCDALKRKLSGNRGGGDPDLFVFNKASGDRFFVEVKDQDALMDKQRVTFKQIAETLCCDVLMARVVASPGARPGDGLRLVSRPAPDLLKTEALTRKRTTSPVLKRASRS